MQQQIERALQNSLNPQTINQATQELEFLRIQPEFTENIISLLSSELALPAIIQLSLSHKNFIDRPPQPYLRIALEILEISPKIPPAAVPKTIQFLNGLIPYLFETGWFNELNLLQTMFLTQQNTVAFSALAACFQKFKSTDLNDEIASKLLVLLENSQESVNFALKNYLPSYSPLLEILEACYSWEDLPDFYLENYSEILQLLSKILSVDKFCFEKSVNVVTEAICTHSEELKDKMAESVQFLIYAAEMYILDCDYEYFVAKILNKLAHFIASPELQSVMLGFTQQLYQLTVKALQVTEQDYDNVKFCDNQFFQCYQSRYDFNSRKDGSEEILKELCKHIPEMKQSIQEQAFQPLTYDNLSLQLTLFRVFAIQSFSKILGMKLQVDPAYPSQFAANLLTLIAPLTVIGDEKQALLAAEILKFTTDFNPTLTPEIASQLTTHLTNLYLTSTSTFYNKSFAASTSQSLSQTTPFTLLINEKTLEKLLSEAQNHLNSEIEIQAVFKILKYISPQLTQQSQNEFLNQILQVLSHSLSNFPSQIFLHFLFESVAIFAKFDEIFAFLENFFHSTEGVMIEIAPFLFQIFQIAPKERKIAPFYQSLNVKTHEAFPELTPVLLQFAGRFLRENPGYNVYKQPAEILKFCTEFGPETALIEQIEQLLTFLVQIRSKFANSLKFVNQNSEIGFTGAFLSNLTQFVLSQKQALFTDRELLKQAGIFLLRQAEVLPNLQEVAVSVIRPAATSFGIRDAQKEVFCGLLVQKVGILGQKLAIEISGLCLGKIRNRSQIGLVRQDKEIGGVGVASQLEMVAEVVVVMSQQELVQKVMAGLGIDGWK